MSEINSVYPAEPCPTCGGVGGHWVAPKIWRPDAEPQQAEGSEECRLWVNEGEHYVYCSTHRCIMHGKEHFDREACLRATENPNEREGE